MTTDKAALVAAVKCSSTYQAWADTPAANEHRPMTCITWYEAMGYAPRRKARIVAGQAPQASGDSQARSVA